jgi:hypothetical protein
VDEGANGMMGKTGGKSLMERPGLVERTILRLMLEWHGVAEIALIWHRIVATTELLLTWT